MHLESNMFRSILLAEFKINGQLYAFANTYLESNPENQDARCSQLNSILSKISSYNNLVFCGDMNFGDSSNKENDIIKSQNFTDIWTSLNKEIESTI